ncbi:efflux RND transporter periplasmic adaptor subunit [Caproiciproducens sp. R2]|uniref:efflux RND transporter periplasmic adaptor subunit n=1 Tax=Caproiciproducens sp. R2 TaxID=3435187 RepID=UPI004033401B
MKKKRKKIILIAVAVIVVAAVAVNAFLPKSSAVPTVQCTPLSKTELRNTVSTTGAVESTDSVKVYTDLNYSVKTLPVEVGDRVSAGDVLCKLDSRDLEDTIAQKQAALSSNAKLAYQKIQASQKKYNDTSSTLNAGLNAQINAAQDKVDSAKRDLENAQQKQSDAEKHIQENLNTSLITAKNNLATAKNQLDNATKTYNDYKKEYKDDMDGVYEYEYQLSQYRNAMESAQLSYDNAQKNLNAVAASADEELDQYVKSTAAAQAAYDSAVKSLTATQTSVNQDLKTAQDDIITSKLSADDTASVKELQALQTKLDKCTVTAPASGTVTAVYAVQNAPANGLMFVIEDTGALKMTVKIKEYDITSVKEGMKVAVTADAIADKEFEGVLEKISPASVKGADGKAASSNDAEFEADVLITSKDTPLRIGMNGSADIILEQKKDVFAVPYDAVSADASGKSVVYAAVPQKDGTFQVQAVTVTTGIETDAEEEISGDGLKEGMQIISDAKEIKPGETVKLAGAAEGTESGGGAGFRAAGMRP